MGFSFVVGFGKDGAIWIGFGYPDTTRHEHEHERSRRYTHIYPTTLADRHWI